MNVNVAVIVRHVTPRGPQIYDKHQENFQFRMMREVALGLFSATCLLITGCSNSLPACHVILDSANANNKLKLVENRQENSYSAILTCGTSNPTIIGRFNTCLDDTKDRTVVHSFFSTCNGSGSGTLAPISNGGRFEDLNEFPTAAPARSGGNGTPSNQQPPSPLTPNSGVNFALPAPESSKPTKAPRIYVQPEPTAAPTEAPTVPPTPPVEPTIPETSVHVLHPLSGEDLLNYRTD